MILQFIFFLSCVLYASAQPKTLAFRLAYQPTCSNQIMIDSFNATGMNGKLDGTGGPYMLFAFCDPPSGLAATVDQLNYHLAHGKLAYEELPDDGLLSTDFVGNNIRITRYAGVPFVNGQRRLYNTAAENYYGPTDVVNGAFYRMDSDLTSKPGLPVTSGPVPPPDTKTILEVIQGVTVFPTTSLVGAILKILAAPYQPPSNTSWTFLVPVDSAFDTIPKYQKELLINGIGAQDLLNNHAAAGSHFAAPLARISLENQLAQSGLSPSTVDYLITPGTTVHNLTMKYAYQGKTFSVEDTSHALTTTDYHCSDGVIHLISNFLYFDEISNILPPPSPAQFVEQYDTLSPTLRNTLGFDKDLVTQVSAYVKLLQDSGVIIPDVELTLFLILDDSVSASITSLNATIVLYNMLPGQYSLSALEHDTTYDTFCPDSFIRISKYDSGATTYINGFATITTPDLKLDKSTIHLIETPFLLAPPCNPGEPCLNSEGWINTTVADTLKTGIDGYNKWINFLTKGGLSLSPPCTILLLPDQVFSAFGDNGQQLEAYLNSNATFLSEFVKESYFPGTIYPNIAKNDPTGSYNVKSEAGRVFPLSTVAGSKAVYFNQNYEAIANIRNDGIIYTVTVQNVGDLIPFEIPPTPVEPSPVPTAPSPIPDPIKPASAALRLNGLWFCLFFVLATLFLM